MKSSTIEKLNSTRNWLSTKSVENVFVHLHYRGILVFIVFHNCVEFPDFLQFMWNFLHFQCNSDFHKFCGIIRFPCFPHILRNEVFNKLICEFQFSTKLVENIVLVEFDFSKADDFDLRVRLANLCVFVLALLFMQKTLRKNP